VRFRGERGRGAGSGYEDLTRQVAALDSTEKGATPLADYYAAKGRRRGSGLVGVAGVAAGDVVTAEQMKHRRQLVRATARIVGAEAKPLIPAPAA
jgi:hypothetical protein